MAFGFCWKLVFSFRFKDLFVSYSGSISADAVSLDMVISDDSQYAAVARTSQKMEFSIKIYSVTKFAVSSKFDHVYLRNR